jgi:hypothetical protein
MTSTGTSIFGRSARKSVSQGGMHATAAWPLADAAVAMFAAGLNAWPLTRVPPGASATGRRRWC